MPNANEASTSESKRDMLRFLLPALGISVASPLMSNIDNAFVGQYGGTQALAALSPGTVLADLVLYLLVFLPRSTVGLVSRARPNGQSAVREALRRPLSVAFVLGLMISALYVCAAPLILGLMQVPSDVQSQAVTYVRIRGLAMWASLMQSVALSGLLAIGDSVTPLKVVLLAAAFNFVGDWALCAWPLHLGVAGAAAATTISTLAGFAIMLRALHVKRILPRLTLSSRQDLAPLLEYAGPLAVVSGMRFAGLACMAQSAGNLGTPTQAAYQVMVNLLFLFGLVGEPISQTAQTTLPPLLVQGPGNSRRARNTLANLVALALPVGLTVSVLAAMLLRFGSNAFTQDAAVYALLSGAGPCMAVCIALSVFCQLIDGTLIAAREFRYVMFIATVPILLQLICLRVVGHWHLGLRCIFYSIIVRYMPLVFCTGLRLAIGCGHLGRALRRA